MLRTFNPKQPLLRQLKKLGLEFDQKLDHALRISASRPNIHPEDIGFPDSYLTLALYRSNTVLTRAVTLDESRYNLFHEYKMAPSCRAEEVIPGKRLCGVLSKASELAGQSKTIGVGHFLKAIVALSLDVEPVDLGFAGFPGIVSHNTFSVETLLWGLGYDAWTPISKAPEVQGLLSAIDGREPIEDFQYFLAPTESGRLIVRPATVLDPYFMLGTQRTPIPRLAVLTQFGQQFGATQLSELLELEDLINSKRTTEKDLQRYFQDHNHLLRLWDYRDVYPQVYLTREDEGPLVPDFVLVDPELQKAMILDLKLPTDKLAVGRRNRLRFSSAVQEACSQLQTYREWFDDPHNRAKLKERFGLEIYRPRLAVLIGRQAEFTDELHRQRLASRVSDIEVATYDDILFHAKRRLALIASGAR